MPIPLAMFSKGSGITSRHWRHLYLLPKLREALSWTLRLFIATCKSCSTSLVEIRLDLPHIPWIGTIMSSAPVTRSNHNLDSGAIYHLECNRSSKMKADVLLKEYQRVEQLRRQSHVTENNCLGQQFVMNCKLPSRYISS